MKQLLILILSILFVPGCHSTGQVAVDQTGSPGFNRIDNPSQSITLVDQLRQISGINVRGDGPGAQVTIRGISSFYGSSEPLFVADGQALSGGLREAMDLIPVADIESIRVLKNPSELSIYGVRGANGVILIQLK